MPRLPPQFNGTPAIIELRQTKGTYERKIQAKKLEIEKVKAYSGAVRNSLLPIGIIAGGLGLGMAGYFVARGLTAIGQGIFGDKIDNIADAAGAVFNGAKGLNSDGSYQTWLCIEGGVYGLGQSTVNQVVVFSDFSGSYVFGGISGAFSKFVATQLAAGRWLEVFGNFNKDAKHVSQLTEGWYTEENYTPPSGDAPTEYGPDDAYGSFVFGSYRYDDFYDTTGTYESAWSINGLTYDEWIAQATWPASLGGPITDEWLNYMRAHPERFTPEAIQYFENLQNLQQSYWSPENPAPIPADTSEGSPFDYDHDNDGIPNWEDEDFQTGAR